MTMIGECWRTHTGRMLARRVLTEAVDGRPVLLRTRREGAGASMQQASAHLACDVRSVATPGPPMARIAAAAEFGDRMTGTGSLLTLISSAKLRHSVLMIDIVDEDPQSWITFAGVFATARRQFPHPAAGLVLLTRGAVPPPSGCVAFDDDGIVDVIDAMAAIRNWSGWPLTLFNEMAMSTAVEVCRGDLDLLYAMTEAGPEVAFDPRAWLMTTTAPTDACRLPWRGRDEPDPMWLARNDTMWLAKRLWRGQLTILFPWLEAVRADYLQARGWQADAEHLEFTPLIERLKRIGGSGRHIAALKVLRSARNELAHGSPVARTLADQLVGACRDLRTALRNP